MTNPFIFGQVVTGESFTNRQKEKQQLAGNVRSGIHTIIISPRRWGKSSLVEEVTGELERKKVVSVVRMDLSTVVDERDFLVRYSKAVLKAVSSKGEELLENIRSAFRAIKPSLTLDALDNSFSVGLNLSVAEAEKGFEEILNLPEVIATKKKITFCVAFDEFQSVTAFGSGGKLQERLRSVMQHHKHVRYVFYGSRKHMMEEIFHHKSAPFYNFGDIIWLKKISEADFIPFIRERFEKSGKRISEKQAARILDVVDHNPQYVQMIANKVWERTKKKVSDDAIDEALDHVIDQFENFYSATFEDLSRHQKGFLFGLLAPGFKSIFSQAFIEQNGLGSSANVDRVRKSLIRKDILDFSDAVVPSFNDPGFRLWLLRAGR